MWYAMEPGLLEFTLVCIGVIRLDARHFIQLSAAVGDGFLGRFQALDFLRLQSDHYRRHGREVIEQLPAQLKQGLNTDR